MGATSGAVETAPTGARVDGGSGLPSATVRGDVLYPGNASGNLLVLGAPLSFWGGVDPDTARIISARHPQCGESVSGRVLALPGAIGSSSSAAVLLELITKDIAPAALLMHRRDAILVVGCLVAESLGHPCPPVLELDASAWPGSGLVTIDEDGRVQVAAER